MIENLRREAYVDAIYRSREQPVVSYFGQVPWEVIASFGILPIRSYGIDYYVVEEDLPMCAMLNSSVEYLRRDKCPFMHVSSYYLVDQYCSLRTSVIQEYFDPVYVYEDVEALILFLEREFGQGFDPAKLEEVTEQSARLSELILQLRRSALDPETINLYQYYTQFIFDLDQRIAYLENIDRGEETQHKSLELGQIAGIDQHFTDHVILEGAYCEGERHILTQARGLDFIEEKYCRPDVKAPAYNVNGCQKFPENPIKYKGEE